MCDDPRTQGDFATHLAGRGFRSGIRAWLSWESQLVYFPLWTASGGKLIGKQKYNWRQDKTGDNCGRYITRVSQNYRGVAAWGWEYYDRPGPLFIVEGIWDAVRAVNAGHSCIAALSANVSPEFKSWLRWFTQGRLKVVIKDNDDNNAGDALASLGDVCYTVPTGKDLNDLTQEQANAFLMELQANLH